MQRTYSDTASIINQEIIDVLEALSNFAKKHGFNTLIKKLKQYDFENEEVISLFNFILDAVGEKFGLARKELLGKRRGDFAKARKICFILLHNHTPLTASSIMNYFERDRAMLYQVLDEFESMKKPPVTKTEKQFLELYNELDKKITAFKKSKKLTN